MSTVEIIQNLQSLILFFSLPALQNQKEIVTLCRNSRAKSQTPMKNHKRILQLGTILYILTTCICCESGPEVGLYSFDFITDEGDRIFKIYRPDSSFIDTTHIPGTPFYDAGTHNLWCLDSSGLRMSHDGDSTEEFQYIYPLYVHRPSNRTDTLYLPYYRIAKYLNFGHVHRELFLDKWIILECRLPGRILGYSHLFDEEYKDWPLDNLIERSYTYEGQRLIFESEDFDFWVINRLTTDLYGPLTEKELVTQLKKLEIPLPVELKSSYFPYKKHRDKTGSIISFPDSMYTHFLIFRYWPHGEKVKPKMIGEK